MKPLVRGFLPEHDPLETLPEQFLPWEKVAKELPKLLASGQFRKHLLNLPPFDSALLKNLPEIERAMQLLSYFGHAYVWGTKKPAESLPAILAKPWYDVSVMLQRPPVLSYASYALQNWKRLDREKPIELGNLVLIQNFLGGVDEEWFILVHVDIEAKATPGLKACLDAISAKTEEAMKDALLALKASLESMVETLLRMPERCDPYIYYNRVRPYIHGWKNHPSFPNGLLYEGVDEYKNIPQKFRGETGAQSSIIPTFDALLGITHSKDELYTYLEEMQDYMPKEHRQFLNFVKQASKVRTFVIAHENLKELYNSCIMLLDRFRKIHLGYASSYIQQQHEKSEKNPHAVGTGGTPFMHYLQKHQQETLEFLL